MKIKILIFIALLALSSCKKDDPSPNQSNSRFNQPGCTDKWYAITFYNKLTEPKDSVIVRFDDPSIYGSGYFYMQSNNGNGRLWFATPRCSSDSLPLRMTGSVNTHNNDFSMRFDILVPASNIDTSAWFHNTYPIPTSVYIQR